MCYVHGNLGWYLAWLLHKLILLVIPMKYSRNSVWGPRYNVSGQNWQVMSILHFLPGLCRISDSIKFQLTLSKLWWYADRVIRALSILALAFRTFSSNSFNASFCLASSEIVDVNGQGLNGWVGSVWLTVSVSLVATLGFDSLTPDIAATPSAEEPEASLLHVCLHPCLSNALKTSNCTFNVHFET